MPMLNETDELQQQQQIPIKTTTTLTTAKYNDDNKNANNSNSSNNNNNSSSSSSSSNNNNSKLLLKCVRVAAIFAYLELLLWSALLHPHIELDVRWIPKSFFSSQRQSTCMVRLHRTPLAWLEVTYFTTLAMFGYFCGCAGPAGVGHALYGTTLASFERAMMGVRQRFWWFCLVPWLVTFGQNWLHNVGEFLLFFISGGGVGGGSESSASVLVAQNLYATIVLMLCYFVVQALLASEVACMALQGWTTMRNISSENVEWEKRKRFFSALMDDSDFGLHK